MPNWKKVITSGSTAVLNEITSSGGIYSAEDIQSRESILGRDTYLERLVTLGSEPSEDTTTNTSIQFLTRDKNNGVIKQHTLGSLAFSSATIPTVYNCTLTVEGTGALGGSGTFTANSFCNCTISISHADTSTQSSVDNTGNTVIQDVTLDGYGHVTGLASKTLSIPTVNNANITINAGSSALTLNGTAGGSEIFTTNQGIAETITIDHATNGSQGSVNNSGNVVIQDVTLDAYGHVTGLASKTLSIPSISGLTSCTGTVTSVTTGNSCTITIGGTATDPTVAANTAAVANGGAKLATGDQIYDHVTTRISGLTSCTGTTTPSNTQTFTNKSGNISQWTNDSGYITDGNTGWNNTYGFTTCTGTTTPSNTQTFTNKSGNISQWTNDSGYTSCTGTSNLTLGTTSTTALAGNTTVDDVSVTNLKTALAGGFGSNAVQIGDSTDTVTIPGELVVTGTVTTNNVETVSTSNGVVFEGNAADQYEGTLLAGLLTGDRTYTLPNQTGTIALTSEIPSNNNQIANGCGYITDGNTNWNNTYGFTTCTGTTTPSNTQTFTNKSGNISQWTNDSGFTTCTGTINTSGTVNSCEFPRFSDADTVVALSKTEMQAALNIADGATNVTNNNQLTNGCGYITDGNTNWNNSYGFTTCTGTLTGNGTSTYIPFYNGTTSFGNTNKLIWDGTKLVTAALNIALQPAQNSEATSLMINSSGDVGTRELGSNAFNSTAFTTCTGTVTMSGGVNNRILTAGGTTSIIGESGLTYDGQSFCVDSLGNYFLADRSQFGCNNAGLGKIDISDDNFGGELGIMTDDDETIAVKVASCTFEYGGTEPFDSAICVVANYKNVFLNKTSGNSTFGSCNIIGGNLNYVNGYQSIVASGKSNSISTGGGCYNVIVGGISNCMLGHGSQCSSNFIGGGSGNCMVFGNLQTIVGGVNNKILDTVCNYPKSESKSSNSFIGAGSQNQIDGSCFAFLGSGCYNCILETNSGTIGGGYNNEILCQNHSSILGGAGNIIKNNTGGVYHTIGGGHCNMICGYSANIIAGGARNCINTCSYGHSNSIGGGCCNCICGNSCHSATVAGGCCNRICNALASTIGGGECNLIKDQAFAFVGGGFCNRATGYASSIIGGEYNNVCLNSNYSSILGGCMNNICHSDYASTVGRGNCVKHDYSHAIGCCLASTTTKTTYMNNATVACHLQVGGTTTLNTTTGRIDATNDIVAYSTSDKRLKENIQPINNALCKVTGVSGNTFDWKPLTKEEIQTIHSNTGRDVGVIAQEIEEVLPEAVTTRGNGYKAVNYEKIVPLLIEAIKEQQKQIDELKSKV